MQRRKSWFQRQREMYGENFLERINADDINRDIYEIIRNIAFANMDLYRDALYFLDKTFTSRLIYTTGEIYHHKLTILTCIDIAIRQGYVDNFIFAERNACNISCTIYGMAADYLNRILLTSNIDLVSELHYKLLQYRHYIREEIGVFPEENPNYKPKFRERDNRNDKRSGNKFKK